MLSNGLRTQAVDFSLVLRADFLNRKSMTVRYLRLFLVIFLFPFFYSQSFAASSGSLVRIYYKQNQNGGINFYAENNNYCPYQVKINFSELSNLQSTEAIPFKGTVEAQAKEVLLFTLTPTDGQKGKFKYDYMFYRGDGAPVSHDDNYKYLLPYEHGTHQLLTQGYHGKFSHEGACALDFGMPEGTSVHAARGGVVVSIKQNSDIGGPSIKYLHDANAITIYHSDGTFADYVHLKKDSSPLKVGDKVSAGQFIAFSGNTGFSTAPHLHFQVYLPGEKHKTIPVTFLGNDGNTVQFREMQTYKAFDPEADKVRQVKISQNLQ
jgi:murein DD-endopeptidase MepM/ murein hydrolase activator NlpD